MMHPCLKNSSRGRKNLPIHQRVKYYSRIEKPQSNLILYESRWMDPMPMGQTAKVSNCLNEADQVWKSSKYFNKTMAPAKQKKEI